MITERCQRARRGRQIWRPAGEVIDTTRYEVAAIGGVGSDTTAKAFVVAHHYEASYVAAVRRFGLYRASELVGVAVFNMPWQTSLDRAAMPWSNRETLELGRFVLLDDVPGNGETWFLARSFELLWREGWAGVLSYSDPTPRTASNGNVVFPGHIGTIYQAHNASYRGRGSRRTLHVFDDGAIFSERSQSKIRARDRGWRYAITELTQRGAADPRGCLKTWMRTWRDRLCRRVRHPGKHTYLWALHRRLKRFLPDSLPYPKIIDPTQEVRHAAQG